MADWVKKASEPPSELEPPFVMMIPLISAISCASAKVWMYFLKWIDSFDFSTSFGLITLKLYCNLIFCFFQQIMVSSNLCLKSGNLKS